jgi:hypothetical protein
MTSFAKPGNIPAYPTSRPAEPDCLLPTLTPPTRLLCRARAGVRQAGLCATVTRPTRSSRTRRLHARIAACFSRRPIEGRERRLWSRSHRRKQQLGRLSQRIHLVGPIRVNINNGMEAERILLVVGASLLVVGPALQALTEVREYQEFLRALDDADLSSLTVRGVGTMLSGFAGASYDPRERRWAANHADSLR